MDKKVTSDLIHKKYSAAAKSYCKTIPSPGLRQRLELSRAGERGAVPCALLGKPSLESFAAAVNGARALSRCTRICLVLGALAALLGIGVLFYLAVTGALDAVSCAKMLLFMCVWGLLSAAALIPVLKK